MILIKAMQYIVRLKIKYSVYAQRFFKILSNNITTAHAHKQFDLLTIIRCLRISCDVYY